VGGGGGHCIKKRAANIKLVKIIFNGSLLAGARVCHLKKKREREGEREREREREGEREREWRWRLSDLFALDPSPPCACSLLDCCDPST